MKMTVREENEKYHEDILQVLKDAGLVSSEDQYQMEQYLWNSLEKGVN